MSRITSKVHFAAASFVKTTVIKVFKFCYDKIEIGEDIQIGPYCQILDFDHKYETVEDLDLQIFNTASVCIGKYVWIGANCVILRGLRLVTIA